MRTFDGGFWVSAGAAYGWAGDTQIGGVDKDDARSNLLYGITSGFSLPPTHAFRVGYFRRETLNHLGMNSHNVLVTWSMRF